MNNFNLIKLIFSFLVEDYGFKLLETITNEPSDYDYQFDIVVYGNEYIWIEIGIGEGLGASDAVEMEVRQLVNGVPSRYNHPTQTINLAQLLELTIKDQEVEDLDDLAIVVREHIGKWAAGGWYSNEALERAKKEDNLWSNKTLDNVEKELEEWFKDHGFYFVKSSQTISTFEVADGPFFMYSNGKKRLKVKYECDVRDQYFCYHIHLTGAPLQGILPQQDQVDKICATIKKMIVN